MATTDRTARGTSFDPSVGGTKLADTADGLSESAFLTNEYAKDYATQIGNKVVGDRTARKPFHGIGSSPTMSSSDPTLKEKIAINVTSQHQQMDLAATRTLFQSPATNFRESKNSEQETEVQAAHIELQVRTTGTPAESTKLSTTPDPDTDHAPDVALDNTSAQDDKKHVPEKPTSVAGSIPVKLTRRDPAGTACYLASGVVLIGISIFSAFKADESRDDSGESNGWVAISGCTGVPGICMTALGLKKLFGW